MVNVAQLFEMNDIVNRVRSVLTPDLLSKKWRAKVSSVGGVAGHCYLAAEVCFHLLGGREEGWVACVANLGNDETHWWLVNRDDGTICDPTWDQFSKPFDYSIGKRTGFLTRFPSKRAQEVMRRLG